jgi:hypothetical protein
MHDRGCPTLLSAEEIRVIIREKSNFSKFSRASR